VQALKPWHVVAVDDFQELVASAVRSLPSWQQVRERGRASVDIPRRTCQARGAGNVRFTFKRCGAAHYCGVECQRRDWRAHRDHCTYIATLSGDLTASCTFIQIKIPTSLRSEPESRQAASTDAHLGLAANVRRR